MRNCKNLIRYLGIGAAGAYLLLRPQQCAASVREGIGICVERLIPALFPYLVVSNLFLASGGAQATGRRAGGFMRRVFHVGEAGSAALLLGLTGGYPVGAKTAASLCREGIMGKEDAQRLLCFCNNAGPAFLFGVIGAACYRSAWIGAALCGVHFLSALTCGILLRGKAPASDAAPPVKPLPPFSEAFTGAVRDAGRTMLSISLLVTVFTVLLGAVRQLFPGNETVYLLFSSVLELSSGCLSVAASALPWAVKFPLTAAVVGWGGVCVHLQTISAISDSGLSAAPYLRAKALQAVVSALLALPLSVLLRPLVQTFGAQTVLRPFSPLPWTLFSIGMTCLIFLQFTSSNSREKGL